MSRLRVSAVAGAAAVFLLAACGASGGTDDDAPAAKASAAPTATPTKGHTGHTADPAQPAVKPKPLRTGERRLEVRMEKAYTPSAPTGVGTDDYRCFLLDPKVTKDSFVTGFNVLPGNPSVVHHVILFRVPPETVAEAEEKDAETPGEGWTCFGTSGLGDGGGIDDAPWLGAWAPGGTEQLYGKGLGEDFPAGSRVVMQVHYNLLAGAQADTSAAQLRLSEDPSTKVLETMLLPAPVELPCRPGKTGPLCDRAKALEDVQARFGRGPGSTANFLHVICGGAPIGPVQSCTREITSPRTIRGIAGHMHLLGTKLKIETNPGTPRARTVLDIREWDFDDQGSTPTPPIRLRRGDTVRITCEHSQRARDFLPSFAGQPERYVMWGDGTTDEMCLGIALVTRP